MSEDPVGATSERLLGPAGLNAFGYASANPLRYTDPDGLESREFCEMKAKEHERYWDEKKDKAEYHSPGWYEAAKNSKQAQAEFGQCEVDDWRFHNLDWPLAKNGFVAVATAPVFIYSKVAQFVGLGVGTFVSAKQVTEVVTGEKTENLIGSGPARVVKYEECGNLMTCDRAWDAVSGTSGLVLSFTAAGALSRQAGNGRQATPNAAAPARGSAEAGAVAGENGELTATMEAWGARNGGGGRHTNLQAEAEAARDALADALSGQKHAPATVVGAYSPSIGRATAGASRGGGLGCAEDVCCDVLGSPSDIQFTPAVRPRTGKPVPVCTRCEAKYGREAFPDPKTRFKSDEDR